MKRRQTETKQTKRKCMEPDINCFLCARVGNEVDFIPIFSTKGKTEQLYQKIMIYTPFKASIAWVKSPVIQEFCKMKLLPRFS